MRIGWIAVLGITLWPAGLAPTRISRADTSTQMDVFGFATFRSLGITRLDQQISRQVGR